MDAITKTFCRICEAACGLEVERGEHGVALRPDRAHPVSRGFVCAKGTRFAEVASDARRLRAPAIRDRTSGALREVSWVAAIAHAAARLRPIVERHGPHAIGLYAGNPLAFHTLGQITAAFFGRALGTRNVFSAGSLDCNNKFAAGALMHGSPMLHPVPDFEHAQQAILFGTNPAVSQSSFVHLEGGSAVFDRMLERGARVVVVDVRETESARRYGNYVAIRAGTDVYLLLAMLSVLADRAPQDQRVEGLETLLALAREFPPERAAAITGIDAARIRALAQSVAAERTALHLSVGVNQGPFGTLAYVALQALAFVSGNYDRRGGSVFSPLAPWFARGLKATGFFRETAERSRVGGFPTVFDTLPTGVLADEILTDGPERIRGLIVVAGDPLRAAPGSERLQVALTKLDALIAIDLFESGIGRHADVVLPATSWLERPDLALPGLALQTCDVLQSTPAVMPRYADARPEPEILAELALALGRPILGSTLASRAIASGAVERLFGAVAQRVGYGLRVPVPRPGTYLGRGPMTAGRRVRFWDRALDAERDRLLAHERLLAQRAGGFVLLGRRRRIGHNSWLHGGVREGRPESEAWLARADMEALGIADGTPILLRTSAGELRIVARTNRGVEPRTVVVPHGELGANVNAIIPSGPEHIEPISGQLTMTGIAVDVVAS